MVSLALRISDLVTEVVYVTAVSMQILPTAGYFGGVGILLLHASRYEDGSLLCLQINKIGKQ